MWKSSNCEGATKKLGGVTEHVISGHSNKTQFYQLYHPVSSHLHDNVFSSAVHNSIDHTLGFSSPTKADIVFALILHPKKETV